MEFLNIDFENKNSSMNDLLLRSLPLIAAAIPFGIDISIFCAIFENRSFLLYKRKANFKNMLPFTVLRYAEEKDKLLLEAIKVFYLDDFATRAGITFIRPSDAVLKKIIEDGKKVNKQPGDDGWEKVRLPILPYLIKGYIDKDNIRPTHYYVSYGKRAHVIYELDGNFYIHDKEVTGNDAIKKGIKATLITITNHYQSIISIPDEMPKGTEARIPNKLGKHKHCLPCNGGMYGGGEGEDEFVNRNTIYEELKEKYSEEVDQFVVATIMSYIEEQDTELYNAILPTLKADPSIDAILLLEMTSDDESRAEPRKTTEYLISDIIITGWAKSYDKYADTWKELYDRLYQKLETNDVDKDIVQLRMKLSAQFRKKNYKGIDEVNKDAFSQLKKIYSGMASGSIKSYPKNTMNYYNSRFGINLDAYLYWADMVTAAKTLLKHVVTNAEIDEYLSMAHPGLDYVKEMKRSEKMLSMNALSLEARGIKNAILPYVRASMDDIAIYEDEVVVVPHEFETENRFNVLFAKSKKTKRKTKKATKKKRKVEKKKVKLEVKDLKKKKKAEMLENERKEMEAKKAEKKKKKTPKLNELI
jgi:hypothetical protein